MEGRDRGVSECVADACIAELPLSAGAIRPVYLFRRAGGVPGGEGRLTRLQPGKARILGRICMEDDILAGSLDLPSDLREGDLIVFGNAGGYERSMSYGFGRG
jgi:diaminopimelate decarboxylase